MSNNKSKHELMEHKALEIKSDSELVSKYKTLVKKIAHHLITKLPPSIQEEDLIQSGMIGLLEASKKYDHTKGASFDTYAGIRIRGAMLDEIRKIDWTPRSVHKNSRNIACAIKEIENKTGREAKDTEIADHLGISLNDYYRSTQDTTQSKVFGFGDLGLDEDAIGFGISENISEPLKKLEKFKIKKQVALAVSNLAEKESMVLNLYYTEELNLREIGDMLGVTESRVSQIHSQAMSKLKTNFSSLNN